MTAGMIDSKVPRVGVGARAAFLQEGWVIANHVLVSFHVAFISSVLAIPPDAATRGEVLRFIFVSPETIVSALFTYAVFHAGIALHELGHFLEAARLRALSDSIQEQIGERLARPLLSRLAYMAQVFALAPYGRAVGIKREGLNFYPDAPYNLAVAAAGPRASRDVARLALPPAVLLLALGLTMDVTAALYAGRLLLGLGIVTGLDFLMADRGKYREFKLRERRAAEAAEALPEPTSWVETAPQVKRRIVEKRMQEAIHPRLGAVTAPWQFRNCGMGGRHTEKEYPESNISMQEAMFLILGAADSQDSQEMTIRLQTRLKEILEKAEGCRVMGIGLEGGIAPYVDRAEHALPEVRLWVMMKQAIEECGYQPGVDVAIALDPALSELEIAYRQEFDVPDSVGMYLCWRDRSKKVLDRDGVLAIYEHAIRELQIPILAIEDGFSEDDHEGWRLLLDKLGDRILVIGDDLVTTNDRTIELCAGRGLINAVLVKANQIGTLYETLLAVLVTLGKGLEVVVSHRSKSPNDDMEAHIALAANALGLKAGGGANTERLVKYQAVSSQMERAGEASARERQGAGAARVERLRACEEPTNAGIPTVGVEVELSLPGARPDSRVRLAFRGATPLGTSAGTGEAVHLIDGLIERAEQREVVEGHAELFRETEPGVVAFRPGVARAQVEAAGDEDLLELFARAARYDGKGCLNAVDNVRRIIAPCFEGASVGDWGLLDVDRALLGLEITTARRRGKLAAHSPGDEDEVVRVAQRKQNLGMNAILSVSLAMARGIAHVSGRELYELLREEMLAIVEHLAGEHGVTIRGSRFADYVAALREVNAILAQRGEPLYAALRRQTGIYRDPDAPREPDPEPPRPERSRARPAAAGADPAPAAPAGVAPAPAGTAVEEPFTREERAQIAALDRALYAAYGREGGESEHRASLRSYLSTRTSVGRRLGMMEIANHRIFRADGTLIVPYDAHGTLAVHAVSEEGDELRAARRFRHGSIVTDALVAQLAGVAGEPIDLEHQIYDLDLESPPEVRIARLRDLALLMERLNECGSRYEAVHLLRILVVRLCSASFQGFPGAKNLQPEALKLRAELARLLNGPFAPRLRQPLRILVRNVSSLISRPKLIDELWQDSIDLAEVHVRGSALTNEIRRSAHHALGRRTLKLARAYLAWLETGQAEFPDSVRERPGLSDEEARTRAEPRALVTRIVATLEQLLGSPQIAGRLAEWRASYAEELVRCESSNALAAELEALVEGGIRARNRWVYNHHLRSLARKAQDGSWSADARAPFEECLKALQEGDPQRDDFDAEHAEREARAGVGAFVARLRADHQERLFRALDDVVAPYERGDHTGAFERACALRREVVDLAGDGVFPQQRYLLHLLDCLLEELGFFALRHVASRYDEEGLALDECLRIVHRCAGAIAHDGLFSRELWDLSKMLVTPGHGRRELLDVLEQVQRIYLRVLHRVSVGPEMMAVRLGYAPEEVRALMANFQRTLHDLNSLAHFADRARAHVQEHGIELQPGQADGRGCDPWDFVHLSHAEDIASRVESWDAPCLQGCYGGKGGGLVYVSYLGIPTRDGFVIPTTLPRRGLHEIERARFEREVLEHVRVLEADVARSEGGAPRLGDAGEPLLLAVRGGSVFSMPGQLATVVFVGMTDAIAESLAREDEWYAWDAYRRFLVTYAEAAWELDLEELDLIEQAKRRHGVGRKTELPGEEMRRVVESTKAAIRDAGHGQELQQLLASPELQLHGAVRAVLASWNGERARRYREIKGLSDDWHTAVVVQQMASGNHTNAEVRPGMDEATISLTGVIPCTRMQPSGFRTFTGDVKFSASGDDLVSGVTAADSFQPVADLRSLAPMLERRLGHVNTRLRRFRGTDPEVEFTVERGVLSVLQVRSAQMQVRVAPTGFDEPGPPAARGIGICGGAFRGVVAFDEEDLRRRAAEIGSGDDAVDGVLLVLENPAPDEIPLILSAGALLTEHGGTTSHAAVAVHGIEDRPYCAVLGVAALRVDAQRGELTLVGPGGEPAHTVRSGEVLSIHGQSGEVFVGSRRVRGVQPTAAHPAGAA